MIAWFARLSLAQSPEEPPAPTPEDPPKPDTIEIAPAETLPSAIDTLQTAHEEVAIGPQLGDWDALPGALVRGRPMIKPLLTTAIYEGRVAVRGGFALGHQWWTMRDEGVQLGGESRLDFAAPIGSAKGYRAELSTKAGPWLGPVGVWVGPWLRADRELWGDDDLAPALLLGPSADLSLLLGPVVLSAGVEPGWRVAGDRARALSGPLPSLGAETAWRAGIGTTEAALQLSLDLVERQTAIGAITELGLTLRLRPF